MSWKYQPSETVWALVSDADTLYGGNVWFQTVERGDVYAVQCYFDSLHWFTFRFHSERAGLAAVYGTYGIEWESWGEEYIFKYADEISGGFLGYTYIASTPGVENSRADYAITKFLRNHLKLVRERPVQKYKLRAEGDMWRVVPLAHTLRDEGGLVDGPGVLPHDGCAWVGGSCRVSGVKLGPSAEVMYSSVITGTQEEFRESEQIWINGDVFESQLNLESCSEIGADTYVHRSRMDGRVTLERGAQVFDSQVTGHKRFFTTIPAWVSVENANLRAGDMGRLPFIQVSNVGCGSGESLSVWYDDIRGEVCVRHGTFNGSAVGFLEKTKKEYETFKRYRARAHESDASELMMYQDLVPCLAAAVMDIKNEGEREKDNGNAEA